MTPKVRTCLAYATEAEEAARFYVSLLDDAALGDIHRPDPDGPAVAVTFTLAGAPFLALNTGQDFGHTPGASISVMTADQAETDRLWDALIADGGEPHLCGWLADRWGVSWQIVPEALPRLMTDPDRAAADRAHAAMLTMQKIDIAALEVAFAGT